MPIILPSAPVLPERKNPKTLVLYGPPKVGKTTMLTQLDGCLIVDCEAGTEHLTALKYKVSNLDELQALCIELINKGKPYKYVAFDTITTIEDWCEPKATSTYKQTTLGKTFAGTSVLELPMGAGYFWLRQEFGRFFALMSKVAENVILIGHVRDSQVTSGTTQVEAKSLDLTGKIRNICTSKSDAIGYIMRDSQGKLKISFETKDTVSCGSRCEHLRGKTIEFTTWKDIYLD